MSGKREKINNIFEQMNGLIKYPVSLISPPGIRIDLFNMDHIIVHGFSITGKMHLDINIRKINHNSNWRLTNKLVDTLIANNIVYLPNFVSRSEYQLKKEQYTKFGVALEMGDVESIMKVIEIYDNLFIPLYTADPGEQIVQFIGNEVKVVTPAVTDILTPLESKIFKDIYEQLKRMEIAKFNFTDNSTELVINWERANKELTKETIQILNIILGKLQER